MDFLTNALGLETEKLQAYQMAARAFVLFFTSFLLLRVAGIRTLGKQSAFDSLTLLMLGAIMGRAVVSEQSFFGSILSTLIIMLLHRLIAWITFNSKKAGKILKGENIVLIKDGVKNQKNLAHVHVTEEDILEAVRTDMHAVSLEGVKEAYLERSGDISIIKNDL